MSCLFWGALLVLLGGNTGGWLNVRYERVTLDLFALLNLLPAFVGYLLLWRGFARFSGLLPARSRRAALALLALPAAGLYWARAVGLAGVGFFALALLCAAGQVYALAGLELLGGKMCDAAGEPRARRGTVVRCAAFAALSLPGLCTLLYVRDGVVSDPVGQYQLTVLASVFGAARILLTLACLYRLHRAFVLWRTAPVTARRSDFM